MSAAAAVTKTRRIAYIPAMNNSGKILLSREEIVARLRAMEPELRARGITRMQMFGSRARGDARPDSDLDLLIDIDPRTDFSQLDLPGMHIDLSEEFGVETHVTEASEMKRRFAREIASDLYPVF